MAMEDAGVTSRDIDAWSLAEVANPFYSTNVAPNVVLSEWVGMRGKPSSHHEEACCSSYCAFKEAVGLISSGIHDMVMIVGVDTDRDFCDATKLPYQRHPGSEYVPSANLGGPEFMAFEQTDPGYSRWNGTYY
jgi:acetyl-CoA C-acetyltransferase